MRFPSNLPVVFSRFPSAKQTTGDKWVEQETNSTWRKVAAAAAGSAGVWEVMPAPRATLTLGRMWRQPGPHSNGPSLLARRGQAERPPYLAYWLVQKQYYIMSSLPSGPGTPPCCHTEGPQGLVLLLHVAILHSTAQRGHLLPTRFHSFQSRLYSFFSRLQFVQHFALDAVTHLPGQLLCILLHDCQAGLHNVPELL